MTNLVDAEWALIVDVPPKLRLHKNNKKQSGSYQSLLPKQNMPLELHLCSILENSGYPKAILQMATTRYKLVVT